MANFQKTVELIRAHGLFGLCEGDGCYCCAFEVHGIHVNISCRKSDHCIRVSSRHMYRDSAGIESVAREVLLQLGKMAEGYRLRFCERQDDHTNKSGWQGDKWVDVHRCCYCGKSRSDRQGYLCEECMKNEQALRLFPWHTDGFLDTKDNPQGTLYDDLAPEPKTGYEV